MEKPTKHDLIKRLVVIPKKQTKAFWSKEMKLLNSLLEMFPNRDFWERVSISLVPSLAVLKTEQSLAFLEKKYREFNYKIPPKIDIPLGEKSGGDKIISKKPKTIRQFIDE